MRPRLLIAACLAAIAAAVVPASPASAQATDPCAGYMPCTTATGPWVTTPSEGDNVYQLSCPSGQRAMNGAAEFGANPVGPVSILVGGGNRPGAATSFYFGLIAYLASATYQPVIACSPPGAITVGFRGAVGGTMAAYRSHVRTERIRPHRHVEVRLGCPRHQRLVHSGSSVAFFTRHPPARRVVKKLVHRHRRTRSGTRTDVMAPAGVGDNERVELQVTTFCAP